MPMPLKELKKKVSELWESAETKKGEGSSSVDWADTVQSQQKGHFSQRHVVAVECQKDPFLSGTVLFFLYGVYRSDLLFYLSWGFPIPELLLAHNGPSLQCMMTFSNLQPVANPGWSPLSLCPPYSPSTGNYWSALYSLVKWHSLGVVLYAEPTNLTLSDCRSVLADLWMDESAFFFFLKTVLLSRSGWFQTY